MDRLPSYAEAAGPSGAADPSSHTPRTERKRDKKAVQFDESSFSPAAPQHSPRYGRRRQGSRDTTEQDLELGVPLPEDLEYTRDWDNNVVCTDVRLNSDPALMAAFLRHHGSKPPVCHVRISGDHWEENDGGDHFAQHAAGRDHDNGDTRHNGSRSSDRRKVTDFSFTIPLTSELLIRRNDIHRRGPVFYTLGKSEKALRGGTFRRRWRASDDALPPSTTSGLESASGAPTTSTDGSLDMLAPSQGQRAILSYLHSTAPLKRFTLEKRTFGWSAVELRKAIERQLRAPPLSYTHDITVRLDCATDGYVHVRPRNRWTRLDLSPYFTVLKWVLFPIGLLWTLLDWFWLGARWQMLVARFDLYRPACEVLNPRGDGVAVNEFEAYHDNPTPHASTSRSRPANNLIDLDNEPPRQAAALDSSSGGGRPEAGMPLDRFLILFADKIQRAALDGVSDGRELAWDFGDD